MKTLLYLFYRDLIGFKREFFSKLFDTSFLLLTNLIVFGYFLPQTGVGNTFGAFMLVSAISVFGFFDLVGRVGSFIGDMEGDKTISYQLTLPLPSYMVFLHIAGCWAMRSALISFFIIPIGKLILMENFTLGNISIVKLIPMFITVNLFHGIFGLWLASILKKVGQLSYIWIRVVNPLVMFGGYFYAWHTIYDYSETSAYFMLINPLLYAMEGMRDAILGGNHFLPYPLCLIALWIFSTFFGWNAVRRLQKRLDCVR